MSALRRASAWSRLLAPSTMPNPATSHRRRSMGRFASLAVEPLEERLMLSGSGLTAQYFHNQDFTGVAAIRSEAISYNWGTAAPLPWLDDDTFSVRWSGQVEAEFSETYTFTVLSDQAARLWVDGQLIVDDWSPHLRRSRSGTIALVAGQKYDIRVDYYEQTGPAQIELSWSSASRPIQVVPADRLYESPAGLLGAYADDAGHTAIRVDPVVDFAWQDAAPAPGLEANDFEVTWTGQIQADFSEEYLFSTLSDDGVRLWIGSELVIDGWESPGSVREHQGAKLLEAGKWYDVRLEYFDRTGNAEIELRWSSERQTGGELSVIAADHLRAAKATPLVYTNPLGPGADPFVVRWEGMYYLVRSQGNAVWIDRAESLQEIHAGHPGSQSILVWAAPQDTDYSKQIWAPELHQIAGRWYIYVAASDGNNATHRMHVLERDAADPFGSFVYKGKIAAATDRWAIDGTAFEWQNKWYFVWSGWPGFSDGQQNLYIAEMRNPWTLLGDRVLISTPQYAWERHGLALNEGPEILVHDGQLHIIYSASGYWTPQYALGRLTFNGVGSPLVASLWIKHPSPVFQANSAVVGVGHASFVTSPDEHEHWIVYHAHANPTEFNEDRVISIQRFDFNPDGTPNFGSPVPPNEPLPVPSTGPEPERPFVAGDFNADGLVDELDYQTWRLSFGATMFPGTSADGNGDGLVDASDFTLWRDRLGVAAGTGSSQPDVQSIEEDDLADAEPHGVTSFDAGRTAIATGAPAIVAPASSPALANDLAIARMEFPGAIRSFTRSDQPLLARWASWRRKHSPAPGSIYDGTPQSIQSTSRGDEMHPALLSRRAQSLFRSLAKLDPIGGELL